MSSRCSRMYFSAAASWEVARVLVLERQLAEVLEALLVRGHERPAGGATAAEVLELGPAARGQLVRRSRALVAWFLPAASGWTPVESESPRATAILRLGLGGLGGRWAPAPAARRPDARRQQRGGEASQAGSSPRLVRRLPRGQGRACGAGSPLGPVPSPAPPTDVSHLGASLSREPDRRRDPEQEAAGLGGGDRRPDQARRRLLVRRLGRGVRPDGPGARGRGHLQAPVRRQAAQQLPGLVGPLGRGPGGGPHLHRVRARGGRGPQQQLAPAGRAAGRAGAAVRRRDAGPHHVRGAVLDGPAGLGDLEDRRAGHRLALRGRVDADHDPHGPGRPGRARRGRVRALRALHRRAAGGGRGGRAVAHQRRHEVHRALPRDARDLVLRLGLRRQRAAGQEVPGAADRLGAGPRRGLAGRAHAHPQAHLARGRRSST